MGGTSTLDDKDTSNDSDTDTGTEHLVRTDTCADTSTCAGDKPAGTETAVLGVARREANPPWLVAIHWLL